MSIVYTTSNRMHEKARRLSSPTGEWHEMSYAGKWPTRYIAFNPETKTPPPLEVTEIALTQQRVSKYTIGGWSGS